MQNKEEIMLDEKKRKTIVIGHKNPDTDSICSAICYAKMKQKLTGMEYEPCRAGHVNAETQFVLDYFGIEPPRLVENVKTQVKDIEIRRTQGVDRNISLKKAWNLMQDENVVTLPAVSEGGVLEGLITVGDIAKSYMSIYDSDVLSKAKTQYKNILETLDGTMVVGDENDYFDQGKVLIAAANPDLMEDYIKPHDLVILGNRYESQLCAIEMNAACIIVCMGAKVSKTIQKLAQEHNCSIIVTPHDTFTVARMINQSMPISHFMKREGLVTFKVTEKTEDIKGIMGQKRYRDFPILDLDGNYIGMISRRNLLNLRKRRLILVDHNEASQTVDGIAFADILEIIDHHRIGTLETLEPVYFRNQPVGCTATIIYQMYQENGVKISKKIAGLLMAAIISDTLMFRSPTCTSIDRMAAEKLSEICGVEIEEFAIDMFSAGSDMSSRTPKEIFNQDKKKFQVGDHSFIVAQINSMNAIELEEVKEKLVPYLSERFEGLGVEMCFVMLTNIVKEDTELLCFGEKAKDVARSAFQLSPDMEHIVLKGLVSRKKQLIPSIVTVLQQ